MRSKLIVSLFLISGLCASHGLLLELEPTVPGVPSKARVVGSRGTADSANYIIQYEYENYVYYFPYGEEDSIVVWFEPPIRCTLCAIRSYWYTGWTDEYEYDLTVAFTAPGTQLTDWEGFNTGNTGPSPTGTVLWHKVDTSPPAAGGWDMVEIPWSEVPDVVDSSFIVKIGHMGTDSFATLGDRVREPPPNHSLIYSNPSWIPGIPTGWYSHYYAALAIRAYVYCYWPPFPFVYSERLPYSYDTGPRTVNIHGDHFGPDTSGVAWMILYYRLNGGPWNKDSSNTPVSGTIDDGIWQIDIPGTNVNDTVDYYVIGKAINGEVDTSDTYTYEILQGNPGNFLFVENDDTPAGTLPEYWLDTCDLWDCDAYGAPDSSVLTFYNTIVWRDWGCTALGKGTNYGAGIYYSDSAWIKMVLDNGGSFWLSDQDQGYGLGICPDYGQHAVPTGHWVREYLGIKGMYDDQPLLGGIPVTAYGNPADPVIGDMFAGIGYQNPGEIYIAPYYYLTGNFTYSYTGSFDSLETGAVVNMFDGNGFTISYRYEGQGGSDYKVYNDFFPWDFIAKPTAPDTLDIVAIDSLVEDVLWWFSWDAVPEDRILEPSKIVKLLPVGIVTNEAIIKFSLPSRTTILLDIFDNTGRLIKNLVNGKVSAGLNTIRWNGKDSYGNPVASGVYFYRLGAGEKTLTNKMVVIR